MAYRLLPVLPWWLCLLAWATTASADGPTLRVMSFNIHHGVGVDGRLDLERIAAVIRAASPDLVALQEVDAGAARTDRVDQPKTLARLTGMHAIFGDNIPYQGGRYGNAVLSRWPVARHENHKLPSHYDGEQRGVLEVWPQTPKGFPQVRLLATHFDYRPGSKERVESARMTNRMLTGGGDELTLLVGDLNATPDSPTLDELKKHWRSANDSPALTFPVDEPTKQIDYVLLPKASGWRVERFEVLNEAVASDHRALIATLVAPAARGQ
ncbi:endonuclease/exonuclease/phosphatase family protein [Posidoniimonas corsicana]|nr:endonuclease/exonuclease/phosphatase family protein [Posidoniimonas corsicana]